MINEDKNIIVPSVLMLMGRQCAFCGAMMQILSELMKEGRLAELRIVNIEDNPQLAREFSVRSVPWLKLGPFELTGSRTKQELLTWLERASSFDGIGEYLEEILSEGNIGAANKLLQQYPAAMEHVIRIVADPEARINVRLGAGVIIEDRADTEAFKDYIPALVAYLSSDDPRIRGDACHYLSLTKDVTYVPEIEMLLKDENKEVREIAQESLEELTAV